MNHSNIHFRLLPSQEQQARERREQEQKEAEIKRQQEAARKEYVFAKHFILRSAMCYVLAFASCSQGCGHFDQFRGWNVQGGASKAGG
jgi:hypothetical protein